MTSPISRSIKTNVMIFLLSIFVCLYWTLSIVINVYQQPVIGAIYEILWLFMIIGLFAIPVVSFVFWSRSRFNIKSLYFYSFLISIITIVILITQFPSEKSLF